jgi:hypothetical protein
MGCRRDRVRLGRPCRPIVHEAQLRPSVRERRYPLQIRSTYPGSRQPLRQGRGHRRSQADQTPARAGPTGRLLIEKASRALRGMYGHAHAGLTVTLTAAWTWRCNVGDVHRELHGGDRARRIGDREPNQVFDAPAPWYDAADLAEAMAGTPRPTSGRSTPPRSRVPDGDEQPPGERSDAESERLAAVAEEVLGDNDAVAVEQLLSGTDWVTGRRVLADLVAASNNARLGYRLVWSRTVEVRPGSGRPGSPTACSSECGGPREQRGCGGNVTLVHSVRPSSLCTSASSANTPGAAHAPGRERP